MKKDCCTTSSEADCNVTVTVDVAKIVRCLCAAGVLIVAIIFGTKCITELLGVIEEE